MITVWNGAEDDNPTTLDVLQKLFKMTVVTAADPNQKADFTIVVGTNTNAPPAGE